MRFPIYLPFNEFSNFRLWLTSYYYYIPVLFLYTKKKLFFSAIKIIARTNKKRLLKIANYTT